MNTIKYACTPSLILRGLADIAEADGGFVRSSPALIRTIADVLERLSAENKALRDNAALVLADAKMFYEADRTAPDYAVELDALLKG